MDVKTGLVGGVVNGDDNLVNGGWRISLFWRSEAKKFKRKKTPKTKF